MAIVLLNIGILAIVAAFQSGAVSLRRASHISTASALADQQMEGYRALVYAQIGFDSGQMSGLDNTYKCDSVLGASCPNTVTTCSTGSCTDGTVPVLACGTANTCLPKRTVSGANSPDSLHLSGRLVHPVQDTGKRPTAQADHRRRPRRNDAVEDARAADVHVRPDRQQLARTGVSGAEYSVRRMAGDAPAALHSPPCTKNSKERPRGSPSVRGRWSS